MDVDPKIQILEPEVQTEPEPEVQINPMNTAPDVQTQNSGNQITALGEELSQL